MIISEAELENLPDFIREVDHYAEKMNFSQPDIMHIELAVEEVFVNIVNYAYPGDMKGPITLDIKDIDDKIIIKLIDQGVPFDITEAKEPDINASIEDREIGGLGIFFVKNIMDSVKYERMDNKNILTLTKAKKNK